MTCKKMLESIYEIFVEAHREAKEEQQETKPENSKETPTSWMLLIDPNTMSTSSIEKWESVQLCLKKNDRLFKHDHLDIYYITTISHYI